MLDDGLVVLQQQLGGQLRQVEELRCERVVEVVDVVLVQPFQHLVTQVLGQILEAPDVEERQQPLVQHQLVCERNLWPVVGAAARHCGCAGSRVPGAASRHQRFSSLEPDSPPDRWRMFVSPSTPAASCSSMKRCISSSFGSSSRYFDTNSPLSMPASANSTRAWSFCVHSRMPTGGLSPSVIMFLRYQLT